MNFDKEESLLLYKGCKALKTRPFAAFTYAAVKACREVLKEGPTSIVQQASMQRQHYPAPDQGDSRDMVGDWLVGPVQSCDADKYDLQTAHKGSEELHKDLAEIGPLTQASFMAKSYGLVNSGAAGFQVMPTYNDNAHCLSRCLFMNNYGVRSMPEGSGFRAWNWNAPLWFGVNTICVDNYTTTLVGSSMWGLEVVTALRDNMEATLREIMSHAKDAPPDLKIPQYSSRETNVPPPTNELV